MKYTAGTTAAQKYFLLKVEECATDACPTAFSSNVTENSKTKKPRRLKKECPLKSEIHCLFAPLP
jgi:hypothetical protein